MRMTNDKGDNCEPGTGIMAAASDQVKPTFRMKWPNLISAMPPPAQCTIQASRMMARMITTSHIKNNAIPGMAYPLMVLVLATTASYPPMPDLIDRLTEACGAGGPAGRDAPADGDAAAGVPGLRRREQPAVPGLALARDDRHAPRRPLA